MANSTIKTRILLRNDEITAWEGSDLVLGAGEIALGRRSDGSYEMRVGDGTKTWSGLGS